MATLLPWLLVLGATGWHVTADNGRALYWTLDLINNPQCRIYVHNDDPEKFLQKLRDGQPVNTKYSHFPSSKVVFGAITADNDQPRSVFSHSRLNGKIYSFVKEENSASSVFRGSSEQVGDLALDWVSKNLYYTDPLAGVGLISYRDNGYKATLIIHKVSALLGIDVDPLAGYIFYVDSDEGRVYQATLTGEDQKVISTEQTSGPTYLAVDSDTSTAYWLDDDRQEIQAWNYRTSTFRVVWNGQTDDFHNFAALEVYKSYLFLPLTTANSVVVIQTNGTYLQDFTAASYHRVEAGGFCVSAPERQPSTNSACDVDNGGCEHICVHGPSDARCLCKFGYTLNHDGKSCKSDLPHDDFLILSDSESRAMYFVQPGAQLFRAVPLPPLNSQQADDATYDPVKGYLYWTERNLDQIWRMNMANQEPELVVSLNSRSTNQGIVMDPYTQQLYYTDASLKHIGKIDLENRRQSVLKRLRYSDKPLDIQIDTTHGRLYWTDWGSRPRIMRIDVSGHNERTLVTRNLRVPSGLALDLPAGHMYFVDMHLRKLERTNLDGRNRQYITRVDALTIGLTLDEHFIYIAHRELKKVSKANYAVTTVGPHFFGGVFGMTAYSSSTSDITGNSGR